MQSRSNRNHNDGPVHPPTASRTNYESSNYQRQQYRSHAPASPDAPARIKCSHCAKWLELDRMEEHVCAEEKREPRHGNDRSGNGRRPDMTIEIPRPYNNSSLSPRYDNLPQNGSTSAHSSNYSHYDHQISPPLHSTSSDSSATSSSNKLPFFERYQKREMNQPPSGSTSKSFPASPDFNISPRRLDHLPPIPAVPSKPRRRQSNTELAYAGNISISPSSSLSQSLSTSSSFYPYETPATSAYSSNNPRSRENSPAELGVPVITTSRSTPSGLASFAATMPTTPRSRNHTEPAWQGQREEKREPSRERERYEPKDRGLDACMEDLRLMAEDDYGVDQGSSNSRRQKEEDEDHNGGLNDFMYGGLKPEREHRDKYDRYGRSDDESLSTPRPRDQLRHNHSNPTLGKNASSSSSNSSSLRKCTTCRRTFDHDGVGDGQICRPCYADRFLPKCRKCDLPIESRAVTSSDGKVAGKYHQKCFVCFVCSDPFKDAEFYVFDGKPMCQHDYHESNGSLCMNSTCRSRPIEGPCVSLVGKENGGGGRYHPTCFTCADRHCARALLEHHYVVDGLPYCERHAEPPSFLSKPSTSSSNHSHSRQPPSSSAQTSRARKRQTFITRA